MNIYPKKNQTEGQKKTKKHLRGQMSGQLFVGQRSVDGAAGVIIQNSKCTVTYKLMYLGISFTNDIR